MRELRGEESLAVKTSPLFNAACCYEHNTHRSNETSPTTEHRIINYTITQIMFQLFQNNSRTLT